MKAMVVYDSTYGNTEKIAQAIGDAITAEVLRVTDVNPSDLKTSDLLIVGSPTHEGRPTPAIQHLLKTLGPALRGVNVAALFFCAMGGMLLATLARLPAMASNTPLCARLRPW